VKLKIRDVGVIRSLCCATVGLMDLLDVQQFVAVIGRTLRLS
jgi:hypothetical protein